MAAPSSVAAGSSSSTKVTLAHDLLRLQEQVLLGGDQSGSALDALLAEAGSSSVSSSSLAFKLITGVIESCHHIIPAVLSSLLHLLAQEDVSARTVSNILLICLRISDYTSARVHPLSMCLRIKPMAWPELLHQVEFAIADGIVSPRTLAVFLSTTLFDDSSRKFYALRLCFTRQKA